MQAIMTDQIMEDSMVEDLRPPTLRENAKLQHCLARATDNSAFRKSIK